VPGGAESIRSGLANAPAVSWRRRGDWDPCGVRRAAVGASRFAVLVRGFLGRGIRFAAAGAKRISFVGLAEALG
jgi:hypothetical protein